MKAGKHDHREGENWAGIVVTVFLAGFFFLLLPAAVSVLEHFVFGTDHFEDFLRAVGLRRPLKKLYRRILRLVP